MMKKILIILLIKFFVKNDGIKIVKYDFNDLPQEYKNKQ